ncbi:MULTISPECIES: hypothetical protein [unclassified Kitasatospora]|uniref:hypothetical protein n=1 Tax=unclassified Kitasatospora TaxID=2633591 RepID=UPI003404B63E
MDIRFWNVQDGQLTEAAPRTFTRRTPGQSRAFSGVAEDLFEHLAGRRLTHYRHETHARRSSWPTTTWDDGWDGPVSTHPDGSVLALRVLPERDC